MYVNSMFPNICMYYVSSHRVIMNCTSRLEVPMMRSLDDLMS